MGPEIEEGVVKRTVSKEAPAFTGSRQLHKIKSNEVANQAEAILGWTDEKVPTAGFELEDEEWTYPEGGFRAYSVVFACAM